MKGMAVVVVTVRLVTESEHGPRFATVQRLELVAPVCFPPHSSAAPAEVTDEKNSSLYDRPYPDGERAEHVESLVVLAEKQRSRG